MFGKSEGIVMSSKQLALVLISILAVQPVFADEDEKKPQLEGLRQPGGDEKTAPDDRKKESLAAYMEGIALQKKGNLADALKAFEKASKADPSAADPVRAHALLLLRLGRVGQARERARKAIELDKNDYGTRLQLAMMLLSEQGNPAEPARLIEEALESKTLDKNSKDFLNIHAVRGRLFLQARDAGKAGQSYRVILQGLEKPEKFGLDFREHQKLMTDRATGYDTVGRVMLEVGRYADAKTAFEALIRINDDKPDDYHFWLALTQYRTDDLENAEKNLNTYFETNRRSRESLSLLNDIYSATKRSDLVVEKLRELTKDSTKAAGVEMFIGDLLVNNGNTEAAAEIFRGVIEKNNEPAGHVGLVRVAIAEQDPKLLIASVKDALNAGIQPPQLLPLLPLITNDPGFGNRVVEAVIASLKDDSVKQVPSATWFFSQLTREELLKLPEQEAVLLQATLDQNPEQNLGIDVMTRLGANLYGRENYAEAAKIYRRLLEIPNLNDPARLNGLYMLSAVEADAKNYDKAVEAIKSALSIRPQLPQLNFQHGLILLQAERHDESEAALLETVNLAVRSRNAGLAGQTRLLLGSLYSQLRQWDKAIAIYQGNLEAEGTPEDQIRRTRSGLSNAYVQSGDLKRGQEELEIIYREAPDDVGINNDLGYLYADQGIKLEQAEKMIRIAVEAEPENRAYLDSLGWVLFKLERNEEALKALLKANSDPDYRDSTIIEHLGDVQNALDQKEAAQKSWQEALDVEQKSAAPGDDIIKRLKSKVGEEGKDK